MNNLVLEKILDIDGGKIVTFYYVHLQIGKRRYLQFAMDKPYGILIEDYNPKKNNAEHSLKILEKADLKNKAVKTEFKRVEKIMKACNIQYKELQ